MFEELRRYGEGECLSACPVLDSLVSDLDFAHELVGGLVSATADALVEAPLGHVPFRHQYSPGLAVLQLATSRDAALSLLCYEVRGPEDPLAETVCFAGGERLELCMEGAADARFFEVLREEPQHADLDCEIRRILPGDALAFAGPRHTKIVDRPLRRMVMLRISRISRISRSDPAPSPAREYRVADGALVHRASGDRAESRDEMAMAVLGAMRRADAGPVLAGVAGGQGSDHLRWQALRQALALDTAAGFAALTAIARNAGDALAPSAGALRASLIERHPELATWIAPCRA